MTNQVIDIPTLEENLRQLVDNGVIFKSLFPLTAFKGIEVFAADYRHHDDVAAMDKIYAYPRQWDDNRMLICDFVYFAIFVNHQLYFILKPKNMRGLYFVNEKDAFKSRPELFRYMLFIECLYRIAIHNDVLMSDRLHLHLRTDTTYCESTAEIDAMVLRELMGDYYGGRKVKENIVKYLETVKEGKDWTPYLCFHYYAGKKKLTGILCSPVSYSNVDWMSNYCKGKLWKVFLPHEPNFFL